RIWGVENVGARLGERGQTSDRFVQVVAALAEVVRAPRPYDPALGRLVRRRDTRYGVIEVADRVGGIGGGVLDPDAGQPGFDRGTDRRGDVIGRLAVAILEITVDRQSADLDQKLGVREMLVDTDCVAPVVA